MASSDEMKFVSATKWREVCVVQSELRQRYQSSCATESETFTDRTTTMSSRRKLFDSTIIGALPCDHLAIASTHDSSSRYLHQGEITRRSMISVNPFRTAGIGSQLDPADRTCARSRRSPLATPPTRDEEISRAEGEYRVNVVHLLFADRRVNLKIYSCFRRMIFLIYFQIFTR